MRQMFKLFLLAGLLLSINQVNAQLQVDLIPDSLLQNAKVVKRFENVTLEIKTPAKATIKKHYA